MPQVTPPASTHALALWISEVTPKEIPVSVIGHIKNSILDTVGCGLMGAKQPSAQIVAAMVGETGTGDSSTLWGMSGRANPSDAALVNGTAVHGFEFDDTHDPTGLHPGAVVIPAVIALAELRGCTGAEVLTAIVVGYEAGIRLAYATGGGVKLKGFHMTGIVGSVAAAAAVASLLKLTPEQIGHALSIGGTQAGGLYSARRNAMTKRLHAGKAGQNGVIAGLLAEKGFTGNPASIEVGYGGFLSCFGENSDPAHLSSGLGHDWLVEETGFKIYPVGASTHTGIECLGELMQAGLTVQNLEKLTVHMTKHAALGADWPLNGQSNVEAAQMNGYFVFALKLLTGEVSTRTILESTKSSVDILEVSKKINIKHDPSFDHLAPEFRQKVRVCALLKSGETISANRDYRIGSFRLKLSDRAVEQKLSTIIASMKLPSNTLGLVGAIRSLEDQKDINAGLIQYL